MLFILLLFMWRPRHDIRAGGSWNRDKKTQINLAFIESFVLLLLVYNVLMLLLFLPCQLSAKIRRSSDYTTMANFLYQTCLQGMLVVIFIKKTSSSGWWIQLPWFPAGGSHRGNWPLNSRFLCLPWDNYLSLFILRHTSPWGAPCYWAHRNTVIQVPIYFSLGPPTLTAHACACRY